jgi:hypothetical protein
MIQFNLTSQREEVGTDTTGSFSGIISNSSGAPRSVVVTLDDTGSSLSTFSVLFTPGIGVTGAPVAPQTAITTFTAVIPAGSFLLISGTATFPALTTPVAAYTFGMTAQVVGASQAYNAWVTFIQGDRSQLRVNRISGVTPNPEEVQRRFFEGPWNELKAQRALDLLQNKDLDLTRVLEICDSGVGGAVVPPGTYATPAEVAATTGVANGANLGTFTGTTIADNLTVKAALQTLETQLEAVGIIGGQFIGSAATFAALPVTSASTGAVTNGDWSILSADTVGSGSVAAPQYPRGVYVYNGTIYVYAVALSAAVATTVAPASTASVNAVGTSVNFARADHVHATGLAQWVTGTAYEVSTLVRVVYGPANMVWRCVTAHTATTLAADGANWQFLSQDAPIDYSLVATGQRLYIGMQIVDANGYLWRVQTPFIKTATDDLASFPVLPMSDNVAVMGVTAFPHGLTVADGGKPLQFNAAGTTLELGRGDANYRNCLGLLVRVVDAGKALVHTHGACAFPAGGTALPGGTLNGDTIFIDPATPGGYTLTRPTTSTHVACAVGTAIGGVPRIIVHPIAQAV